MIGSQYFFKKKRFESDPDLKKKVFYEYKGYLASNDKDQPYHPIVLHFGRHELSFSYLNPFGKTYKIFSLPVAEGELNQKQLAKKIESYWKMPLWKPKKEKDKEATQRSFLVEKSLIYISFFSILYGFSIEKDSIKKDKFIRHQNLKEGSPYDNNLQISIQKAGKELLFTFLDIEDHYYIENKHEERWEIDDEKAVIKTEYINFRKLFLDFLYEFEFASTFEDENFLSLQPILQNNKLIFALLNKCKFYDELRLVKKYCTKSYRPDTPKEYRSVEKAWLNVCFSEEYREIFISRDSVFLSPEDEVKNVLFNSRLRLHNNLFKRTELFTKQDIPLRNQASTFFLRRYLIFNAFDVLMPRPLTLFLFFLFAITPFSDYLFGISESSKTIAGTYTLGMPIFMAGAWIWYYWKHKINLFKLVLPRLFLGILIGWAAFWGGEESWKSALIASGPKLILLDILLFFLLFLYIFTDIRNKLILTTDWQVAKRAFWLLLFAMVISLVQGHYVIQFKARTIIENSGFLEMLTNESEANGISILKDIDTARKNAGKAINMAKNNIKTTKDKEKAAYAQYDGKLFSFNNYAEVTSAFFNFKLRYIWSVLFTQFLMSILIGIILQLIWEDRPITEPL